MSRRLLDYGDRAVLVECADLTEVRGLQPAIERRFQQVVEIVPGARTLLLRLDWPLTAADRAGLLDLVPDSIPDDVHDALVIEVDYSGPDLAEVATLTGLSEDEVVAAHTGQLWTVAFCGFAPGFGYLIGQDRRLHVPRRSSPRASVPAGSVGLADQWSGIYPRSAPGGWQLIGVTDAEVWNLDREQPALLRPGVRVRFEARR